MKTTIETIDHSTQRYDTVGDYQTVKEYDSGSMVDVRKITVSKMDNSDYEFLVGLHEMIEQHLCAKKGISEQLITDFDVMYEKLRGHTVNDTDEPGNCPLAPYHKEHVFATQIEKAVADALGVDWGAYDAAVNAL